MGSVGGDVLVAHELRKTFKKVHAVRGISISVAPGGFLLSFTDNSTSLNSVITVESGSRAQFTSNASASGSNIIANDGASLLFSDNASARGSIVQANDSGFIDISGMATGISMGTIMGNGSLFLGATQLTVGDRDESSTFIPALAQSFARNPTEIPVAHAARRHGQSAY